MEVNKINIAILISGRGSNMESLIHACAVADFPARVAVVISNRPGAAGLAKAASSKIPIEIVDHMNFSDKASFEAALQKTLKKYPVDLICLAGFMRLLSADFIKYWPGRIINIHPSLLPDYKGLDTHERVLAAQRVETGCTVHYVIPAMDEGPIILQKKVPVHSNDTVDTLAARVLAQEHIVYPEAVRLVAEKLGSIARSHIEIS